MLDWFTPSQTTRVAQTAACTRETRLRVISGLTTDSPAMVRRMAPASASLSAVFRS
jgi:hypothetical protein